jgi:hypothetical protein
VGVRSTAPSWRRRDRRHDGVVNLRIRDGQDLTDAFISHIPCVLT